MPWIATPKSCSFNRIATQMFARHGVTPNTVIEADHETTLKSLVSNEIGLTLLREDVALTAESNGELTIWDGVIEVNYLYFIYIRSDEATPIIKAIKSLVRNVWKLDRTACCCDLDLN
jgi:DNA-binding transcriptional LysR family regulator